MENMNRLHQSVNSLTAIALVASMSLPAIASTDMASPQGTVQLAQGSLAGQCRAAKQQIPIFRQADSTSEALRLLAANEEVTLAGSTVDGSGFINISGPIDGYVHAVNLKTCGGSSTPSGDKGLCRQVARPPQGLLIRREPSASSAQVGSLAFEGRVTLTANPPTTKQADNRNWVEISAPARGWVSNGLVTEKLSNLVYCE